MWKKTLHSLARTGLVSKNKTMRKCSISSFVNPMIRDNRMGCKGKKHKKLCFWGVFLLFLRRRAFPQGFCTVFAAGKRYFARPERCNEQGAGAFRNAMRVNYCGEPT
jgi:hypothetical protein